MNKVDYLDMPVALCNGSTKFFNGLTIYENFLLIASEKDKKQEAFDKIERILDGLGLKKYENYSPSELSKGTMQRLNNACAMIQEEKITIFIDVLRSGSSHYTFRKSGCMPITIPKHEPIKKVYVEMVRKIVESEAKNHEDAE